MRGAGQARALRPARSERPVSVFVLPLGAVGRDDVAHVGAKAARLGMLGAEGFPVPAGFCVTTAAWDRALGVYREQLGTVLAAHDPRDAAGAQATADALAPLLARLAVPPEVARAVREALATLAPGPAALAVRSSARAEDGAGASFAGQYTTVLGVRDVPAVLEALLTCWRSFFSATALARAKEDWSLKDRFPGPIKRWLGETGTRWTPRPISRRDCPAAT